MASVTPLKWLKLSPPCCCCCCCRTPASWSLSPTSASRFGVRSRTEEPRCQPPRSSVGPEANPVTARYVLILLPLITHFRRLCDTASLSRRLSAPRVRQRTCPRQHLRLPLKSRTFQTCVQRERHPVTCPASASEERTKPDRYLVQSRPDIHGNGRNIPRYHVQTESRPSLPLVEVGPEPLLQHRWMQIKVHKHADSR